MRLKTYIVDKVADAIPQIKRDLGADALILSTKKVKKGGVFGLFQKEKLEVIAAIESKGMEKAKGQPANERPVPVFAEPETVRPYAARADAGDETGNLIAELKSIKQFMMHVIEEDRLPDVLKPLSGRLDEQGVKKEVQSEILAKMMVVLDKNPAATEAEIGEAARLEIIRMIRAHQKAPSGKNPDIVCFIGPTGVGKTTTIAKIAADYLLREDKKVGLITSDTYRIAAVEQLKTYAGILNIPVKVVESFDDLVKAMAELSDCDIVLMDTAGRNYQQKQYIDDLESLLADQSNVQINLVLSLTSKFEDMKRIIDNFKTIKMDNLILTKKDETSSAGAMLNLIYRYSIPVRFIANGQNVPDDLLAATSELIADFVLGENGHD